MDMRSVVLILTVSLLLNQAASGPAAAQPCDAYPSSGCPAPGVGRGSASYPCFPGQVKADWNTMLYWGPGQTSYASTGYEVNADTWCFDHEYQAQDYGFRRARY